MPWTNKVLFKNRFGFLVWITISRTICTSMLVLASVHAQNTESLRFQQLRDKIWAQPYEQLPQYQVKAKNFGKRGNSEENRVLVAGKRTLRSSADLIELATPHKLLQANGICFSGYWHIHSPSDFTGLFSHNTKIPAIVRASVSLSGTKQTNKRAFGLAIKLMPYDLADKPSINIFTLNSLGGVIEKHVLDLSVDNEPDFGQIPKLSDISTALRLKADLQRAEKQYLQKSGAENTKPNVTYRGVDHVAAYKSKQVLSPKWVRFSASSNERVNMNDFRDELDLKHYSQNQIIYSIEVAKPAKSKKKADWQTIGELVLKDSTRSLACDRNLHFQHPDK